MTVFSFRTVHPIVAAVSVLMMDDENHWPAQLGAVASLQVGWSVTEIADRLEVGRDLIDSLAANGVEMLAPGFGITPAELREMARNHGVRMFCHDRMFMVSLEGSSPDDPPDPDDSSWVW